MLNSAKIVMQTLLNNGYEAYLVGGAVRDKIMGITPKDYDIATNAHPQTVKTLFSKTIPTGEKYGTITVMINDAPFEVTTYRLESEYIDGRRPNVVKYADNLKDDLSRRDFTFNAMAMDIDGNIIDYFNGISDIKKGIVRCVGNNKQRLEEDKLRILRAIRFCSRYDFKLSNRLFKTLSNGVDISNLSRERVRDEFNKILISRNVGNYLYLLKRLKLLEQIVPEIKDCYDFSQNNPNHSDDVFKHIITVVNNTEPKLELRLSAFFHDIGKPQTYSVDENGIGHFYSHHKESAMMCREAMTRLRYSNKEIEYVSELVYWHISRYDRLRTPSIKKFINKVGVEKLDDLFKLQIADIQSSLNRNDISSVLDLKSKCEDVIKTKQPLSVLDLDINGHDLIALGYKGKEIGNILNNLLEIVLNDEHKNKKDILLNIVKYELN